MQSSGGYQNQSKGRGNVVNNKKKCGRCGYNHVQGRCPADGKQCLMCGKSGHFRICCPSQNNQFGLRGSNIPRLEGFGRSSGQTQTSNQIIEAPYARSINNTDNDDSEAHYMFQVSKSEMRRSADVVLNVEGLRCGFMIDSG